MAIKHLPGRALPYRVYWRNPFTGKIQTKHVATLADARKLDSLIKHQIQHDPETLRPEDAPEPTTIMTVESIVWAHLRTKKMKPENLRETIYHAQPVLSRVGAVPVADLKKAHLRDVVAVMRESGLAATTINRRIAIIKAALNWAEAEELIEVNPVRSFSAPRGQNIQIPPPSPSELEAMLSVAMPHIQRVIIMGLSFGVRVGPSELFSIKWEHVDLFRWIMRVWSADKNMNRQYRDLKIRESLRPIFAEWREQDAASGAEHLINWHHGQVKSIKRAWKETMDKAGITRRIRPYDLRHAHATEALANGADVKAVAENMGHSDTTMIYRHYQHVLVRQREAALESVPTLVIRNGNTNGHISADFCITSDGKIQ